MIAAGQSATSRLVEVISTDDESLRMPPEGDRLTEAQIAIIKKWIDSGIRENAGSSAAQRRTLGFKPMAIAATNAAVPVPNDLPPLSKPPVKRAYPIIALANSSRAPVMASSSYQAIDLIDPSSGRTFGSVSFEEGEPLVLKFSQSGRILMAGGGKPVQSGSVVLFDASTGKVLWQYNMPSGVTAVPSSFEVNGEQYIAVQAGWGIDAQRMQNGIDALNGNVTSVPQGGTIMVFKLEK